MSQPPSASSGETKTFPAGTVIFKEGDPGGDLFFIKEGVVEVYREKDGHEVTLAKLGMGDVLGLMTCLTNEPRLASARVTQDVVALFVKHENFEKLIQTTPKWMKVVLKEYMQRVKQIDDQFGRAMFVIGEMQKSLVTKPKLASQLIDGFAIIGEMMAMEAGDKKIIPVGDCLDKMEKILGRPKADLQGVLDILVQSELIKLEKHGEKGNVIPLAEAKALQDFSEYLKSQMKAKGKKKEASLANTDQRQVLAICDFSKFLDLNQTSEVGITFEQLTSSMEKVTQRKFEPSAIERAAEGGYVRIDKGTDGGGTVYFIPAELRRKSLYQTALKKLDTSEKSILISDEQKSRSVA